MEVSILQLPLALQLTLSSGYAAYLIAYRGIREHHKALDTGALTLVFSLAATLIAYSLRGKGLLWLIPLTFAGTVVCGVVWRLVAIDAYQAVVRKLDLSWADDSPSAWFALQSNTRYRATQLAVLTDDGTWLRCDNLHQFNNSPFGPCLLGTNGDVALYLTHEDTGDVSRELKTVQSEQWGDRLTYVPAARIKRLTIRLKPKA